MPITTTTTHTPGPWTVKIFPDKAIVSAPRETITCFDEQPVSDITAANARLIAAAPAMLQALKEARWALTNNPHDKSCQLTLPAVEAAIAQATGR